MSGCIFGIKCNGVSIRVSSISIDADQSQFDYICNVSLAESCNGNGAYDVSIINKDYMQGMPVGKWRITQAGISYNWGTSRAWLVMEDENGDKTKSITADTQNGSASSYGFHVPSLAKTIFTKAQEIVRDYPNAKICNAILDLNKSQESVANTLSYSQDKENCTDEEFIDHIEFITGEISEHVKLFKESVKLIEELEDQRSKQLFKTITSDCRKLLDKFKAVLNSIS